MDIIANNQYEYLLLDYHFAYCYSEIRKYIDCAVFMDTPLDIALARGILRDMKETTGEEIREELNNYLRYARIAYSQMQKDVMPSSDYVLDGTKSVENLVEALFNIIKKMRSGFIGRRNYTKR